MLIKRREGHDGTTRAGRRRGAPPAGEDAYESNWYRVLARMAETDPDPAPGSDGAWVAGAAPDAPSSHGHVTPDQEPAPAPDGPPNGTLELADGSVPETGLLHITGPTPPSRVSKNEATLHAKGSAPALERPRVIHSIVRIGVRKAADPEEVYVGYLTRSPHADYFRSDWWPGGRGLTPGHLWRANHLGAGWELEAVRRFMAGPAAQAERLLEGAPRRDAPGTPARRMWFRRLVEQDWVQELGVPRVCKTLHPLAPELIPSLDPVVTPWARAEWLGLRANGEAPDSVETWTDVWELLEDTLVLRGDVLGDIVRSARERAPGRAPVGRLGLLSSLFWDSYWTEVAVAQEPEPRRPVVRGTRAAKRSTSTGRGSGRTRAGAESAKLPSGTPRATARAAGSDPATADRPKRARSASEPPKGADARARAPGKAKPATPPVEVPPAVDPRTKRRSRKA